MTASDWIVMGHVTGLFGVRGWVKIRSYTDPLEALLKYPAWRLEFTNGSVSEWRLSQGRPHGSQLVASLEGLTDREVARTLIGASIQVRRDELPPLAQREYYQADLIGFEVVNEQGRSLGQVMHFIDMPAHAVMVVKGEAEKGEIERWLPVTPLHLRRVDLAKGEIRVDWPVDETDDPADGTAGEFSG